MSRIPENEIAEAVSPARKTAAGRSIGRPDDDHPEARQFLGPAAASKFPAPAINGVIDIEITCFMWQFRGELPERQVLGAIAAITEAPQRFSDVAARAQIIEDFQAGRHLDPNSSKNFSMQAVGLAAVHGLGDNLRAGAQLIVDVDRAACRCSVERGDFRAEGRRRGPPHPVPAEAGSPNTFRIVLMPAGREGVIESPELELDPAAIAGAIDRHEKRIKSGEVDHHWGEIVWTRLKVANLARGTSEEKISEVLDAAIWLLGEDFPAAFPDLEAGGRLFEVHMVPAGHPDLSDISQIIFKSNPMMHGSHRRGKEFLSAAIRRPDFGDWAVFGSPFRKFSRHPDTPLPSFLTHRVFPRPTPERVFVANHQSGPRFSETSSSAPRPRPIGT